MMGFYDIDYKSSINMLVVLCKWVMWMFVEEVVQIYGNNELNEFNIDVKNR